MFVLAVVLLNLLIAIVSDEFDQFMERANLEAQLALASMCKEAQQVRGLGPKTRPDLFPRHLYILQVSALAATRTSATVGYYFAAGCQDMAERSEGNPEIVIVQANSDEVPDTDEWAGKVKAVVNVVQASHTELKELNDKLDNKLDAKMEELNDKLDDKVEKLDNKVEAMGAKLDDIMSVLKRLVPDEAEDAKETK